MALDCPRCDEICLDEIEVGDVLIDRCPRCAGIWFDHDEVGGIVGRPEGLRQLESIVPPVDTQVAAMRCPRCPDVTLRKIDFQAAHNRSLTAFRCVSCAGTWIDRGELREAEDPLLAQTLKQYFDAVFENE